MTLTLVSVTPVDGTLGYDPSEYVVYRFSNDDPAVSWVTETPTSGGITISDTISSPWDEIIVNNVVGSGWDVVTAIDGTDLVVSVRPIGGWAPDTNYGVVGEPDTVGGLQWISAWVADESRSSGWAYLQEFAGPHFVTGSASSTVTSASLAASVADVVITWRNVLETASVVSWSVDSDLGALVPDENAIYKPASRLYDGVGEAPSSPAANSATLHVVIDLGAGGATFDMAAVLGHNFDLLTDLTEVALEAANNDDFSSGLVELYTWTTGFDRRLVTFDLGPDGPLRYTARYVRLRIEYDGTGVVPEIGELFLARRWSPPSEPDLPLAIDAVSGSYEEWTSYGGGVGRTHSVVARGEVELAWPLVSSTERGDAIAWAASLEYGAHPCVLARSPDDAPEESILAHVEIELQQAGPFHDRITVTVSEIAPIMEHEGEVG